MILVFGKNGQVGNELSQNKNVIALDRNQADLLNPNECFDAVLYYKPRAVINAAAYTAVDKAENDESKAYVINGEAPAAIAKACKVLEIPLVHISTEYIFDGSGDNYWSTESPPNPINVYGKSKLKGEEGVIKNSSIYAIIRTSWVFSSHGNNFVKTMLKLLLLKNTIQVVSDQIGGPTSAKSLAKACLETVRQLQIYPKKSGIYHFCGNPTISWFEFASIIFYKIGRKVNLKKIPTSGYPTPAKRPLNSAMDCNKIYESFKITQPKWEDELDIVLDELGVLTNEKT
jgi:dTDP-4-dehydrorhamnose reductase